MKKDALIAVAAMAVVAAVTFGVAAMRPPFQPTKSTPFATTKTGATPLGKVVMRINGEPVTQSEFEAAFAAMPDEMKTQFESEPGKQAFAEQYVRMKILEQEGRRIGVEREEKVEAALMASRTNIVASAAADKLVAAPTKEAVEVYYRENAPKFEAVDLSHIVLAYAGSTVTPRNGGQPPSEIEATNLALKIYQQLKSGAKFEDMVHKYSDDMTTLEQGGHIAQPISHGMLPPELDSRIWTIPPGQFSGPIPSRFGIHIFKVNSKKTAALPQVSRTIERHVKQQNTFDRVESLRKAAKIEFDPKFFPEAKNWPSNNPNHTPRKRPS